MPVPNPGSLVPLTSSCYRHLPQEMPVEGEIEGEDDPLQEGDGVRTAARKGEADGDAGHPQLGATPEAGTWRAGREHPTPTAHPLLPHSDGAGENQMPPPSYGAVTVAMGRMDGSWDPPGSPRPAGGCWRGSRCHVHPQPLAACSPWPIGAGHVVAVVVLLQWGQGQNQHRVALQGCETHGHHLSAEQWKWNRNAPCKAVQGLSSWRGVEEPRVRRSAGRREM